MMIARDTIRGIVGILITTIFIIGFILLFTINSNSLKEINTIGIAAYNLPGMVGQKLSISIYLFSGLLSSMLSVWQIGESKTSINTVGKLFLAICGLCWASFGFIPYSFESSLDSHSFLIRISLALATGPIGLMLIGSDYNYDRENKFVKLFTVSIGSIILLISALSLFVFDDKTWIRTNVSFLLYFLWFGIIGFIRLRQAIVSRSVRPS